MSAQPVEDVLPVPCVARARSVAPNCRCPTCRAKKKRRDGQVRAGIGVGLDTRAWAVVDHLTARGWSARTIASATGIPYGTLSVALSDDRLRGHRRRWGPATASLIIRHGPPTAGRVGATGARRRLRALSASGWGTKALADRYPSLPRTSLLGIISGASGHVEAGTATAIDEAWRDLAGTPGVHWQAISRAQALGWAPAHAWRGVDIDDPGLCLLAYPAADTASPSKAERATLRARRDRERLRKRQLRQESRAKDQGAPCIPSLPTAGSMSADTL